MRIFKDVKENWILIAWLSLLLVIVNIALALIPSLFFKGNEIEIFEPAFFSWSFFFLNGIFVPFIEETLMRGIIQKQLIEKTILNRRTVYIIIAILFSFFHFEVYFLPFFITSYLLSYAYEKSKQSLIVPIAIHSMYNMFVVIFN